MKRTRIFRGVLAGLVLITGTVSFGAEAGAGAGDAGLGASVSVTTETTILPGIGASTGIGAGPAAGISASADIGASPATSPGTVSEVTEKQTMETKTVTTPVTPLPATPLPTTPAPVTRSEETGVTARGTETRRAFDEPIPVRSAKDPDLTYYDSKFAHGVRSIIYNVRDGVTGMFNNHVDLAAGLVAGGALAAGKATVLAGDVVGFVDDNIFTRPLLRGAVSDVIEEFSYYLYRCPRTIMYATHDMTDIAIVVDKAEYVDDDVVFKTRLYLRPHPIIVIPATIVGDGIIRPVSNLARIFSIRRFADMQIEDLPTRLDQFGMDLIRGAYNEKFFFPIPEEDEPDMRIYLEEEAFGPEPPGFMHRP
jgi:hypothetical protein